MSNPEHSDADLLRQFAQGGSEAAFRELVQRHIGLVHTTARRVLNSAPHLADDVTQNVFTDLAKKAATLSPEVVLAGWLHRHSYYLALNTARAEHRRQARERTAMEINAANENSVADAQWAQLAPMLDEALSQLEPADRDAIVLRYLEQRDLRSVGTAIGLSEDSAQKRVARALEKLRAFLSQRGMTVASAIALASTLDVGAKTTPVSPALLAYTSDKALAKAAAASTASALFSLLKIMTITQKRVSIIAAILILAGLGTALFMSDGKTATSTTPAAMAAPARAANVETPKLAAVTTQPRANTSSAANQDNSDIALKLERIVVPSMNIDIPTPLDQIAQVLHALSLQYDPDHQGVKIAIISNGNPVPKITLTGLNRLSLRDLLEIAGQIGGYSYDIENGVVTLRPGSQPMPAKATTSAVWLKLAQNVIPSVNIDVPTPLDQVAQVLHDLSVHSDPEGKGINIAVVPGNNAVPKIMLTASGRPMANQTLYDLLNTACKLAGYSFSVEGEVVLLKPKG